MDIGTTINHYRIIDRIGEGGMGVVYLAEDSRLHRKVALKFISNATLDATEEIARFQREARAAARLNHPNICTVYELGETEDKTFIAMEYVKGGTLKDRMRQDYIEEGEIRKWLEQIGEGLRAAHDAGVIHRDIKPANIMITDRGLIKIMDFGIARLTESETELTRSNSTIGTIAYMSPEQARGGKIDHRTDIWSVGVILYELTTGQRPFTGAFREAIMYAMMHEDPVPPSSINRDIPTDIDQIIKKCLQRERDDRYDSLEELLCELKGTILTLHEKKSVESVDPSTADRERFTALRILRAPLQRWVLASLGMGILLILMLQLPLPWKSGASMPTQKHLAVLPFENVGGERANQAFIDGLVYTVSSKLTQMEQFQGALSVIPARDVIEAGPINANAAADRFNVTLVLSGSVQRTERGIRINFQLIDTKTNQMISSRTLDVPLVDITVLQDGVVFELAALLDVELNSASQQVLTAGRTAVQVSFDFYTQALGYLQRFEDESNIDAAISLLKLAIKEDSSYALAYASLGEAYLLKYQATNEAEWVEQAITHGERSVAIDDDLASVHLTLGMIYAVTGRDEKAELEYLRALSLEPNRAEIHHQLAEVYYRQDKTDKAEASYKKAIEIEPESWLFHNNLGQFYSILGRHEEAMPAFEQVIMLQPDNPWGYNNLGAQYHRLGKLKEAYDWYQKATEANPNAIRATAFAYSNLAGIDYTENRFAEAAAIYEKVVELQDADPDNWLNLGDSYHWIGDGEKARSAWMRAVDLAEPLLNINPLDSDMLSLLAVGYARLDQASQALIMINRLEALERLSAGDLLSIGKTYEILGERETALEYINTALASGYSLSSIEASAWLDSLRSDSQYQLMIQPLVDEASEQVN